MTCGKKGILYIEFIFLLICMGVFLMFFLRKNFILILINIIINNLFIISNKETLIISDYKY